MLDDYLAAEAVTFIEWPDAAEPALSQSSGTGAVIRVALRHEGGDRRRVTISGPAGRPG